MSMWLDVLGDRLRPAVAARLHDSLPGSMTRRKEMGRQDGGDEAADW
jgi:hypothetical protein